MPSTTANLPTTASGWGNSSAVTSTLPDVADSAGVYYGFGIFGPTPNLVCSGFGLDAQGVATLDGVEVSVSAFTDGAGTLRVYLARDGSRIGDVKSQALTTTRTVYTFGGSGDSWGAVLNANHAANLQVVCYVDTDDSTSKYVDYVSAKAYYPAGDAVPSAFSFTPQTGMAAGASAVSNFVTVAGTTIASAVTVDGGEWSKNNQPFSSADGSVVSGDYVSVRTNASLTPGATVTPTLTIGGVTAGFSVTTSLADTTPDAFTFGSISGVATSTVTQSGQVAVSGITASAAISVTGGEWLSSVGWTSGSGYVSNGELVQVRGTSSGSFSTTTTVSLTIGGVVGTFQITTRPPGAAPDAFTFTDQTGVALSTVVTSNTVTLSGIESALNVTISGGTYSKNGGAYTSAATTAVNGDTFNVRHTSAAAVSSIVNTTLTVGSYSEVFSSTTAGADTTPGAFTFTAASAMPSQFGASNTITITGINVATPVTATAGCEMNVNFLGYSAVGGTIQNLQPLSVRARAPAVGGQSVTHTVTVGTVSTTFTVTARRIADADF